MPRARRVQDDDEDDQPQSRTQQVEEEEDDEDDGPRSSRRHGTATYGGAGRRGKRSTAEIFTQNKRSQNSARGRHAEEEQEEEEDDDAELDFDEASGAAGGARSQMYKKLTQAITLSDDESEGDEAKEKAKQDERARWQVWENTMKGDQPVDPELASKTIKALIQSHDKLLSDLDSTVLHLANGMVCIEDLNTTGAEHPVS